ncbi:MAG: acetyl-CoA carboxylase biotin carboxyl carrier protein, partial [Candidatus Rokubacteria bacterium]|nr:acetyl-CoA carboxylase biotin carboxyl carrier protein [Candidatus Rokubacteria bacterium]
ATEAAGARKEGAVRPRRQRGHEVKAPMVGIFYRAPAPGAPPFVEVASLVTENDTVCIIEVMKLMNSIRAGCRGRVVEICVENGAVVEFGQTLMVIEPPSGGSRRS